MFLHPKIFQQPFPNPNLNIGKICARNEGRCQSYEGDYTPYPLHSPIVCHTCFESSGNEDSYFYLFLKHLQKQGTNHKLTNFL